MIRGRRAGTGALRAGAPARAPLALALALAALAGCGGPARTVEEAATLERDGRPRDALALYQAALAELGDGPLDARASALRLSALRRAADIAYLHTGDYAAAIAYDRRLVALAPGTAEARQARETIAEIYRARFKDLPGAIAQWAALAQEDADAADPAARAAAPAAQLMVARLYLEAANPGQARTEARALAARWPASPEAAEAALVTVQAFAQEKRLDDAQRAALEAATRSPRTPAAARALETAAALAADEGRLERAEELYARAQDGHPNPQAVATSLAAVRRRRAAHGVPRPGDRAAALDHVSHVPKPR